MSMNKLTVRFEDPFWVGIVEVEDEGGIASRAMFSVRSLPCPRSCVLCVTAGGSFASQATSASSSIRRNESIPSGFAG